MIADHDCPSEKGVYLLVVKIDGKIDLGRWSLSEGYYVYVGSAGGPGGLASRLVRHFRRVKRVHWHIDRLTSRGDVTVLGAFYSVGIWGREAEACLSGCLEDEGFIVINGFGSSDDKSSKGHLFKVTSSLGKLATVAVECFKICDLGGKTGWCNGEG